MSDIALRTPVDLVLSFPTATWAGANPFARGYCLGLESGELVLTNANGDKTDQNRVSKNGEAVNGLAYSQNWLAVTTRSDINLVGPFSDPTQPQRVTNPVELDMGGAFDIAVAPTSGHFVVALGLEGVLFVKPGTRENDPLLVSGSEGVYFYRLIAVPHTHGNDLVVSAARRGGVAYAEYRQGIKGHMLFRVDLDLDIVDVCSLATDANPLAFVAVATDGTLVFFEDLLSNKNPLIVKFQRIAGTVDRILTIQGDIYVLTTDGLFCLLKLATDFVSKRHLQPDIARIAIDAADMNGVDNRWLVAVGADAVFVMDATKTAQFWHDKIVGVPVCVAKLPRRSQAPMNPVAA